MSETTTHDHDHYVLIESIGGIPDAAVYHKLFDAQVALKRAVEASYGPEVRVEAGRNYGQGDGVRFQLVKDVDWGETDIVLIGDDEWRIQ